MAEIQQPEAGKEINNTTYVVYVKLKPAHWLRAKTPFPKDPVLVPKLMSGDSQPPITPASWNLIPSCGPEGYQQTCDKYCPPLNTIEIQL